MKKYSPLTHSFNNFDSYKIQKNQIFACLIQQENQYENLEQINLKHKEKQQQIISIKQGEKEDDEQNFEDLWNQLDKQNNPTHIQINKIQVITIIEQKNIEDEKFELTKEELEEIFGSKTIQNQESCSTEEIENFQDLWNEVDNKTQQYSKTIEIQNQSDSSNIFKEQIAVEKKENINNPIHMQMITFPEDEYQCNVKLERVLAEITKPEDADCALQNLIHGLDYVVYDTNAFALSCFKPNTYSYFGFSSDGFSNSYKLFDLRTNQCFLECVEERNCHPPDNLSVLGTVNGAVQYEKSSCLKFLNYTSQECIAVAYHRFLKSGILYQVKRYNEYEDANEDTLGLIEVSDGYIGQDCFCNTNAYIAKKSINRPSYEKLEMNLNVKDGNLIAHMGINSIQSSPYNCRLENKEKVFAFLFGLYDGEDQQFTIRVGEGVSPVMAMCISISRKKYIDSFKSLQF